MATPAGARAEKAFRARHQEAWPPNLYSWDLDHVRVTSGRKLLLEVPSGGLALCAEYKGADEGPLDLNALQFEVISDAATEKLPAYVSVFTHPEMDPPQPWAFRL